MSGEPVRRTPSGRPLRLVDSTGVPVGTVGSFRPRPRVKWEVWPDFTRSRRAG